MDVTREQKKSVVVEIPLQREDLMKPASQWYRKTFRGKVPFKVIEFRGL